jgi:hypothetical protein
MAQRTYSILVDDRADVSIADLADRLREHGVEITQQLDAIGVIVGVLDDAVVSQVRATPGVAAVEEEREIGPASE